MVSLKPNYCINTANKTNGFVQLCCHQGHPSLLMAVCSVRTIAWSVPWMCCWHLEHPLPKQQPSASAPSQHWWQEPDESISTELCPLWGHTEGSSVTLRGSGPPFCAFLQTPDLQLQKHRGPAHTLGITTDTQQQRHQPEPAAPCKRTSHHKPHQAAWCSSWIAQGFIFCLWKVVSNNIFFR